VRGGGVKYSSISARVLQRVEGLAVCTGFEVDIHLPKFVSLEVRCSLKPEPAPRDAAPAEEALVRFDFG
jgi:hypothetical protein